MEVIPTQGQIRMWEGGVQALDVARRDCWARGSAKEMVDGPNAENSITWDPSSSLPPLKMERVFLLTEEEVSRGDGNRCREMLASAHRADPPLLGLTPGGPVPGGCR